MRGADDTPELRNTAPSGTAERQLFLPFPQFTTESEKVLAYAHAENEYLGDAGMLTATRQGSFVGLDRRAARTSARSALSWSQP
jgi:hypothetical protein